MHQEHQHFTQAERLILMKISELLTINESVVGKLNNAESKIVAAIAALQASVIKLTADLADAPLTEAQANSVNDVVAATQKIDDIVPDVVVPPALVVVPDLTGLSFAEASNALTTAGLVIASVGDTASGVISQEPVSGTSVALGSVVTATF